MPQEHGVFYRQFGIHLIPANVAWINQPAADTEWAGSPDVGRSRHIIADTQGRSQFRVTGFVSNGGAPGADFRLQGAVSPFAVFSNLDGAGGPEIDVSNLASSVDTGWVTLPSVFRVAALMVRVMGKDGNGVADPRVNLDLWFR